ncbi:MAG: hypothetical protein LCH84_16265 [Gemmatimonadetes bacterium]|nr:hypothetical protein [Gemmatimonadota bacterium]
MTNPTSGAAALIASLFANSSGPSGAATQVTQTPRASSAPRARRVADDALVFEDIPTRPDAVSTARFGDDVWDFAPVITLPGEAETSNIHFTDIGDPAARLAAKEFGWARLRFDLTGHGTPKAITVRSELRYLKAVYRDLNALFGIVRWAEVTQEHLDRFLPILRHSKGGSVAAIRNAVIALQRLAMARQYLSDDTLLVDPWAYGKADVVAGYAQPMDNLTPEVPAPVLAPLLQWAEHYVTVWADEIIAALARAERPASAWSLVGPTRKAKGAVEVRREAYLAHLRRTGRGLPTSAGRTESAWPEIGFAASTHAHKLDIASDVIGLEMGYRDVQHQGTLAWPGWAGVLDELGTDVDVAWRRARETGVLSLVAARGRGLERHDAWKEAVMLQTACFVLNVFYSGMRISELSSQATGCRGWEDTEDGLDRVPVIRAELHKDQDPGGRPETWPVHDLVHDAVGALEQLRTVQSDASRGRLAPRGPLYYQVLPGRAQYKSLKNKYVSGQLNGFAAHVNSIVAAHAGASAAAPGLPPLPAGPIPLWKGEAWRLTPHQLRESLLRRLAMSGGVITAALQAKHRHMRTLLGYSGRAASNLLRETEAKRDVAEMELMHDLLDGYRHGTRYTGRRGERLNEELRVIVEELEGKQLSETELDRLLKHRLHRVYHGPLTWCFYDPASALCRKDANDAAKASGPLISACSALQCANAVQTEAHLPAWSYHEREAQERLERMHGKLGRAQVQILEASRDGARAVQDRIRAGLPILESQ